MQKNSSDTSSVEVLSQPEDQNYAEFPGKDTCENIGIEKKQVTAEMLQEANEKILELSNANKTVSFLATIHKCVVSFLNQLL